MGPQTDEFDPEIPGWPIAEATTIGDVLVAAARRAPDALALISGQTRLTYRELLAESQRSARQLAGVGVNPGDRVGLLVHDPAYFVPMLFGIALCGAVAVPINTRFRSAELGYVVANADVSVLVVKGVPAVRPTLVERVQQAFPGIATTVGTEPLTLAEAPMLQHIVCAEEPTPSWAIGPDALRAAAAGIDPGDVEHARGRVRLREIGMVLYTSGTSAQPKGVPLTHEALVRTARALVTEKFRMTSRDRVWMPLPMFHIAGIVVLLGTVFQAGRFLTDTNFDPEQALEQLEREAATIIYPAFATIALALVGHHSFAQRDLSSVRLALNVGSAGFLEQFQKQFPQAVEISGFGLTEVSGLVVLADIDDDAEVRFTTCGRPLRGVEMRIVDPITKQEVAAGEPGEIALRGYCNFEGYHRLPVGTSVSCDGWFFSSDLGRLDPQGRLIYLGRLKDMFKVGGENVAAAEVEAFLDEHPKVRIAQVVPVPDQRLEAVPAAFIELVEGVEMSEREVVDYCAAEIASYKVPRHVRFVTDWPMSATKIQKFRLQEQLASELGLR